MFTAFAEYTHDAEISFLPSAVSKVDDGSAVVIVDMAVSGASADGTCFKRWLKLRLVGVEEKF